MEHPEARDVRAKRGEPMSEKYLGVLSDAVKEIEGWRREFDKVMCRCHHPLGSHDATGCKFRPPLYSCDCTAFRVHSADETTYNLCRALAEATNARQYVTERYDHCMGEATNLTVERDELRAKLADLEADWIADTKRLPELEAEVKRLKAEVAEARNDLKQASDGFDVLSQQYLTRAEQTEAEVERLRKVIPLARRLLKWTGPPWFDKQPPLNHLIRDLQDAINEADDAAHEATEGKR